MGESVTRTYTIGLTTEVTMPRAWMSKAALVAAGMALFGCTNTSHVALLSDGDLRGKQLANVPHERLLQGEDCGMSYYLANAFRRATEGTPYDTLVAVEVTSTAGLTPFGQCVKVKGWGVRSADLPAKEN